MSSKGSTFAETILSEQEITQVLRALYHAADELHTWGNVCTNAEPCEWCEAIRVMARLAEPSVCLAGNPTVEGLPCGDPECVCA